MPGNEEIRMSLGLATTAFNEGLKDASRSVESFSSKLTSPLKALQNFGGALAGLAAFGGVGTGIKAIADEVKEMSRQAERMGVSVEYMQRFATVARKGGLDFEEASKGLNHLNVKIGEARNDKLGAMAQMFAALKINLLDSNDAEKSTEQITLELVRALSSLNSVTEKARYLRELNGKEGVKWMTVLAQGEENFTKKMEAGHVVTSEATANINQLGDATKGLWHHISSASANILGAVIQDVKGYANLISTSVSAGWDAATDEGSGKERAAKYGRTMLAAAKQFSVLGFSYNSVTGAKDPVAKARETEQADAWAKFLSNSKEQKELEKTINAIADANLATEYRLISFKAEEAKLEEEIAKLLKGNETEQLRARTVQTELAKKREEIRKTEVQHAERELDARRALNALMDVGREIEIAGAIQKQAILQDRVSKATELTGEYLKDEAALQKAAVSVAEKQMELERAKADAIRETIKAREKELAMQPANSERAFDLQKQLTADRLALEERIKAVKEAAGKEAVRLGQIENDLKKKREELGRVKTDRLKFASVQEAVALGYNRNQSPELQNQLDVANEVTRLESQAQITRQWSMEEAQKLQAQADALRKTLSPEFFQMAVINPFKDLEDATKKLTAEFKAQQEVLNAARKVEKQIVEIKPGGVGFREQVEKQGGRIATEQEMMLEADRKAKLEEGEKLKRMIENRGNPPDLPAVLFNTDTLANVINTIGADFDSDGMEDLLERVADRLDKPLKIHLVNTA